MTPGDWILLLTVVFVALVIGAYLVGIEVGKSRLHRQYQAQRETYIRITSAEE